MDEGGEPEKVKHSFLPCAWLPSIVFIQMGRFCLLHRIVMTINIPQTIHTPKHCMLMHCGWWSFTLTNSLNIFPIHSSTTFSSFTFLRIRSSSRPLGMCLPSSQPFTMTHRRGVVRVPDPVPHSTNRCVVRWRVLQEWTLSYFSHQLNTHRVRFFLSRHQFDRSDTWSVVSFCWSLLR